MLADHVSASERPAAASDTVLTDDVHMLAGGRNFQPEASNRRVIEVCVAGHANPAAWCN